MCGKYLAIQMKDNLEKLIKFNEIDIPDNKTKELLLNICGSSIDRLLKPIKEKLELKSRYKSKAKTGNGYLKAKIPFDDFKAPFPANPGKIEIDTVFHCDKDNSGSFARTVNITDIYSGWTEPTALLNDAHLWIKNALEETVTQRLPFPVYQLDSDNGNEIINKPIFEWCEKNKIKFTRSRPYRKNDNAHIENKNGSVIRKYAFYYRYDTTKEVKVLNNLYSNLRIYINYLLPTKKTIGHTNPKDGRPKPIYDSPKSPYLRLLDAPGLNDFYKNKLRQEYKQINPAEISRNILKYQNQLIKIKQRKNLKNQDDYLNPSLI